MEWYKGPIEEEPRFPFKIILLGIALIFLGILMMPSSSPPLPPETKAVVAYGPIGVATYINTYTGMGWTLSTMEVVDGKTVIVFVRERDK